ncbi:hypothetical protein [Rudaeicoccus suwonensis]|nr:hypothetical protein [Rudaeicoccus suwonensis]
MPEVRLIGGEMPNWSDQPRGLGVLEPFLRDTLADASGSVLLIGASAVALATACPAATVVVRGTTDAARVQAEVATADVCCGGLDRLPESVVADTVILLDGPGEVLTPDSPGTSHVDVVTMAQQHVAPGGRLLARVASALSPSAADTGSRRLAGNEKWWTGTSGYDTRPPVLSELPWPPTHFIIEAVGVPTLVAELETVRTLAGRAAISTTLSCYPALTTALDAQVLEHLADGWLVVLGAPLAPSAPIRSDAIGGTDQLTPGQATGSSLEALLLSALRCGQQVELRRLLTRYAAWVASLTADDQVAAVPRHTVLGADGLWLVAPAPDRSAGAQPPVREPDVAVAHGLLDLAHAAVDHQGGGMQFPPERSATDLARDLGALIDLPEAVWHAAEALRERTDLPGRRVRRDAIGGTASGRDAGGTDSQGDATIRITELTDALRDRDTQITDLRNTVNRQTRRVRALEHAIATEHGPRARRALFLMTAPTQRIVEAARSRLRR